MLVTCPSLPLYDCEFSFDAQRHSDCGNADKGHEDSRPSNPRLLRSCGRWSARCTPFCPSFRSGDRCGSPLRRTHSGSVPLRGCEPESPSSSSGIVLYSLVVSAYYQPLMSYNISSALSIRLMLPPPTERYFLKSRRPMRSRSPTVLMLLLSKIFPSLTS